MILLCDLFCLIITLGVLIGLLVSPPTEKRENLLQYISCRVMKILSLRMEGMQLKVSFHATFLLTFSDWLRWSNKTSDPDEA